MYKISSGYNWKKKIMEVTITNKLFFVSYKIGLIPISHEENGCWAIKQING